MGEGGRSCCGPSAAAGAGSQEAPRDACAQLVGPADGDKGFATIVAGSFKMGSDSGEGFVEDGEGPARDVSLSGFQIGRTSVTNAMFSAFVRETGYMTEAEQRGRSFVFWLQLDPSLRGGANRPVQGLPWWIDTEGACWQRPEGPGSHVLGRETHPVVHVSWNDAQAYVRWARVRLPTEAEWECAARGGLDQARYPWGDDLGDEGRGRCNIWRGRFPAQPAADWRPGTIPADAYRPNGYGVYNMAGNVWEWCEDGFDPAYHRVTSSRDPVVSAVDDRHTMRGGSFLCHESYCNRYRVAARSSNTASTSTSHLGFRVVRGQAATA